MKTMEPPQVEWKHFGKIHSTVNEEKRRFDGKNICKTTKKKILSHAIKTKHDNGFLGIYSN